MPLNAIQKKQLKAQAHKLKPIVFTGLNGLTENVKKEINRALDDHELIKIRIHDNDREVRREIYAEVCEALSAESLQLIGGIGILYRKNLNKKAAVATKKPLAKKKSSVKNKSKK